VSSWRIEKVRARKAKKNPPHPWRGQERGIMPKNKIFGIKKLVQLRNAKQGTTQIQQSSMNNILPQATGQICLLFLGSKNHYLCEVQGQSP